MSTQAAIRSLNQRLGASGDWRRRLLLHHVPLALASTVVLFLFMSLRPFDPQAYLQEAMGPGLPPRVEVEGEGIQERFFLPPQDLYRAAKRSLATEGRERRFFMTRRVTYATGYLATALIGLTLLIGPANLLLRRRTPVSSYFRRDVGTWTAIFSVVHVIFGWQLHGGGRIDAMLNYFIVDGRPMLNNFGLGNWTGLAALVIVVLLLALSTDDALRKLKAKTWKDLQRLNYTLSALVILHIFFYGALLRMTSPYTVLGILTVIAVVVGQAVGVWLWRRRHSRRAARLA